MPRLLILTEYPTLLGGERSMLATLPAVAAAGIDIHVAAPPAGLLAEALRERGVSHIPWSPARDDQERLLLEPTREALTRLLEQFRPDLLHANSLSTARISGPVVADAGVCSIGHLRDIARLSRQAICDLNQHTQLVAVSHATRDAHVKQGLEADRCAVLYNGVDLDEFRPRTPTGFLHRELRLPAHARLVVTIGQLGLRKGTEVVLAAAAQVANRLKPISDGRNKLGATAGWAPPEGWSSSAIGYTGEQATRRTRYTNPQDALADVHWLIVGERTSNKDESRTFESNLRRVAAEPPLAGRVHFLGSRVDVRHLMNECVLLIHAARQEPLGRVLLEAAASGLAIVATDVGGTREIFPTAEDGAVLVPPNDSPAIANAMTDLLTNELRRESLAKAARRRAEAAFDIQLAARSLVSHYQNLLK